LAVTENFRNAVPIPVSASFDREDVPSFSRLSAKDN